MSKLVNGSRRYGVWIKIDDAFPWFELNESYRTKSEAQMGAEEKLNAAKLKVVNMSTLDNEDKKHMPLIRIKAIH